VFVVVAILVLGGELYFGTLVGDLTRVGALPERDFGRLGSQPAVQENYLRSYPISEADILVIGDSFSESLVWQSRLAQDGMKPGTLHWNDIKLCSEDFGEVVRQAGFQGHYVVIESIERVFQDRMRSLCRKGSQLGESTGFMRPPPQAFQPGFSMNRSRLGAFWVLEAMANRIRYTYRMKDMMEFGETRIITTDNGCDLFSNRLCKYGLYYSDDFSKNSFISIGNVLEISRNLEAANMQVVWLVVPDKSTVYLGHGKYNAKPYVNIWDSLELGGELGVGDMDQKIIQESRRVKDIYAPNDTHLSTTGYLFMGDLMVDYINHLRQSDGVQPSVN
jgi:hypothetical protein